MRLLAIVFAAVALTTPRVSEAQIQGPEYVIDVSGLPMSCKTNSGKQVAIYYDYSLNNIGIATADSYGAPINVMNPNVVNNYSPIVKQWWFAHECAHHALGPWNNESNADCFGAKQLVRFGILNNRAQLQLFVYELANLPGSLITGHMPGTDRAKKIASCALGLPF